MSCLLDNLIDKLYVHNICLPNSKNKEERRKDNWLGCQNVHVLPQMMFRHTFIMYSIHTAIYGGLAQLTVCKHIGVSHPVF